MADRVWTDERKDQLRRLWVVLGGSRTKVARAMGVTRNSIVGQSRVLGLPHVHQGRANSLAVGHPAVLAGRTKYPEQVKDPPPVARWDRLRVLVSGESNRKLGAVVLKGRWRGMPIYSLTLEERATCPTSCAHWRTCYGNNMHRANRYRHGPELVAALTGDLAALSRLHPRGYVVRLHVLGDFYDLDYLRQWRAWLALHPALRVFGYTAHPSHTPIGEEIDRMRRHVWDRFAVRTSDGLPGEPRAITVAPDEGREQLSMFDGKHIVCPAQTGATASCASCGLCWHAPTKVIAFKRH